MTHVFQFRTFLTVFKFNVFLVLILASIQISCSKKRPAVIPDSIDQQIFAISDFKNLTVDQNSFSFYTDNQSFDIENIGLSALSQDLQFVKVNQSNLSQKMTSMILDLVIPGKTNKAYSLVFNVEQNYLTAFKVVTDITELSEIEKQVSTTAEIINLNKSMNKTTNKESLKKLKLKLDELIKTKLSKPKNERFSLLIPLFKYKITSYGQLKAVKNELKEETSILQLQETEWLNATHIQVNLNSSERIGFDYFKSKSNKQLENIYLISDIDDQLMNINEFESKFKQNLNLAKDSLVHVFVAEKHLQVYAVLKSDSKKVTHADLTQLQSGQSRRIKECNKKAINQLKVSDSNHCVLKLVAQIPLQHVEFKQQNSGNSKNGISEILIEKVLNLQQSKFVEISENSLSEESEEVTPEDESIIIKLSDILDKEFYFRKTLEDITSEMNVNIMMFSPGLASPIYLVKFRLSENHISIVKTDNLHSEVNRTQNIDDDEIMSFHVKYLRKSSNLVKNNNQLITTHLKDAEYVQINLNTDAHQNSNSIINLFGLRSCFSDVKNQTASDIDYRITKGILSYSLVSTADVESNCIEKSPRLTSKSLIRNKRLNIKFKERISLMINDKTLDKPYIKGFSANVKDFLSLGVFTHIRYEKEISGRFIKESKKLVSLVPDYRNGKTKHYYIKGVPKDNALRKLIVSSIQIVFKDWNEAYRKAFEGTKDSRNGDYLTFEIIDENKTKIHIGDLDKNIININMFHSTRLYGISQTGFNPKSGIVISDIITIYFGNMISVLKNKWNERFYNIKKHKFIKAEYSSKSINDASISSAHLITNTISSNSQKKSTSKFNIRDNLINKKKNESFRFSRKMFEQQLEYTWIFNFIKNDIFNDSATITSDSEEIKINEMHRKISNGNQYWITTKQSELTKKYNSCFYSVENDHLPLSYYSTTEKFENETNFIVYYFRNTLSHEIGHSEGLVHNFAGSFDKANFSKNGDKKIPYSSIMDYANYFNHTYSGVGRYDIHVLRALHTNRIEVESEIFKNNPPKALNIISRSEYDKSNNLVNLKSIENSLQNYETLDTAFQKSQFSNFFRSYKFCTDGDLDLFYCRKRDTGTSYTELIKNLISEYENHYTTQFGYIEPRVDIIDENEKIQILFNSIDLLVEIRSVINSMQLISSTKTEESDDVRNAIRLAKMFLISVAAGPNTDLFNLSSDKGSFSALRKRFYQIINGTKDNKVIHIQLKSDKDILQTTDSTEDRHYDTIGNEINKLVALQLLIDTGKTDRISAGNGLNPSFLDFEDLVEGKKGIAQSEILKLIKNILLNDVSPIVLDDNYQIVELNGLKQNVDLNFRMHTAMLAMLNLENSFQNLATSDLNSNLSNLLKIRGRSIILPKDNRPILQIQSNTQVDSLRFWPLINNSISEDLFHKTKLYQNLNIENNQQLRQQFTLLASSILNLNLIKTGIINGNVQYANKLTYTKIMENQLQVARKNILTFINTNSDLKLSLQSVYAKGGNNTDAWSRYFIDQAIAELNLNFETILDKHKLIQNEVSNQPAISILRTNNIQKNNPILNLLIDVTKNYLVENKVQLESLRNDQQKKEKINFLIESFSYFHAKNASLNERYNDNLALIDYLSRLTDYVSPYR